MGAKIAVAKCSSRIDLMKTGDKQKSEVAILFDIL